jgi:CRISPR/Cas system-associated exonuclease Cas4 (RecB family)
MTEKEHELEQLLYYANRKLVNATKPYELTIEDREETINSLEQLKGILEQYSNPVNIKIKEKKLGKK